MIKFRYILFLVLLSPNIVSGLQANQPISVTEEYLKVVPWEKVQEELGLKDEAMTDLKKMVYEKIIPKEKEFSNKYYVLYHGQPRSFLVLYDLAKQLYQLFNEQKVQDFEFLRIEKDLYPKEHSAMRFLLQRTQQIHDWLREFQKILLPVNFSFPGNLLSLESSFQFYAFSSEVNAPTDRALITTFLKNFYPGITKDTVFFESIVRRLDTIIQAIRDRRNKYGSLLQIFIPKPVINDYVYPAVHIGVPRLFLGNIFEKVTKNPKRVESYLGTLQARILLKRNAFAAPGIVKIYKYHHLAPEVVDAYQAELALVVSDIFKHWQETYGKALASQFSSPSLKRDYQIFKKNMFKASLERSCALHDISEEMAQELLIDVYDALASKDVEIRLKGLELARKLISQKLMFKGPFVAALCGIIDRDARVRLQAIQLLAVLVKNIGFFTQKKVIKDFAEVLASIFFVIPITDLATAIVFNVVFPFFRNDLEKLEKYGRFVIGGPLITAAVGILSTYAMILRALYYGFKYDKKELIGKALTMLNKFVPYLHRLHIPLPALIRRAG